MYDEVADNNSELTELRLAVFCYNFPHKKSQDFIIRLFLEGIKVVCVFAADPVELNIPPASIRTKIRHIGLLHPRYIAERLGIEYFVAPHNSSEVITKIKDNNLNLGIIAGARILKAPVIESFSKGIINFHPGLIPEARGLDAMLWSIYKSIPLGVTAHLIDENIDAGYILLKEKIFINPDDTLLDPVSYTHLDVYKRQKVYRANTKHPLFPEIHNMVRKFTGIDQLIPQVLSKLGDIHSAYIVGDYARAVSYTHLQLTRRLIQSFR